MRGEPVIVRALGGKPLKRRVWDVGIGVVYITNDEQYQRLVKEIPAIEPIGFPVEDVFKDAENQSVDDGSIDWSRLVKWRAEAAHDPNAIGAPGHLKEIGVKPTQYLLRFELAAWGEFESPRGPQLPMFPSELTNDGDTEIRNSKKAFDAKNRRRFSSSIKRISKERTSQGSEWSLLAGLTAATS